MNDFDFSKVSPEEFEHMCSEILSHMGNALESRPARGPDQGKDFIAVHTSKDDQGFVERHRTLIECKNFAKSGKSVRESDVKNIEARMRLHKCDRYLLITSTILSESVKNQIIAISQDPHFNASFWDGHNLVQYLKRYPQVHRKYLFTWQEEAKEAVGCINRYLFRSHKGAIRWSSEAVAIFGNTGNSTPKIRKEIACIRSYLTKHNIVELAFATHESASWVILAKTDSVYDITKHLWNRCTKSKTSIDRIHNDLEEQESHDTLYVYYSTPYKHW